MGIFQRNTVSGASISSYNRHILAGLSLAVLLGAAACAPHNSASSDFIDLGADTQGIVGGISVGEGELEIGSTVGIFHHLYSQVFCTGTLVAKDLVLTAAHCTTADPTMLSIYFERQLGVQKDEARARGTLLPVTAGKTHDQWAKNTFATPHNWGDMALLRFEGALPAGYKPVRILANRGLLKKGQLLNLVGFGLVHGTGARADGLNRADVAIENPEFSDMEILMNQQDGKGACHGDSGGPAYIKVDGELVLVGVTSRGYDDPNDTCEMYGVYTSPSTEMEWLKAAATELQQGQLIGEAIPQPGEVVPSAVASIQ